MPEDVDLQKRLLAVLLSQRRMAAAIVPAERILQTEPNNADALFTMVWQSVRTRSDRAPELLAQLRQVPSSRVFQTLAMAADYFRHNGQIADLQEVLSTATQLAASTDRDGFALLTDDDVQILPDLLQLAVAQAADRDVAVQRASDGITVCETLAAGGEGEAAEYARPGDATAACRLQARFPESDGESTGDTGRAGIAQAVASLAVSRHGCRHGVALVVRAGGVVRPE